MQQRKIWRSTAMGLLFAVIAVTTVTASNSAKGDRYGAARARLAEKVRHQLNMLPYYGVFDHLEFQLQGQDTVVLSGEVTKPTLKRDAGSAVKQIEGAGRVVNRIEVLPLSPSDDRIRIAQYRAIYSKPGLDRYALAANPSIHIIVKNGHVTLVGVVDSQADRDLAYIAANGVSGVFSVTSNLKIQRTSS